MDCRTAFKTVLVLVPLLFPLRAGASLSPTKIPDELRSEISAAARRASLDPKLVEALIRVESNFKPNAVSNKGAMGLMQVMKGTADECEIHDPYHTVNHLMGACDCLRKLINRYQGNLKLALAAYNAGPAKVTKYAGIPPYPETQRYVKLVLEEFDRLQRRKKK